MIYDVLEYAVLVTAVTGVILNNHKLIWCFPIWMVSNTMSGIVHINGDMTGMYYRDLVFIPLAIHGWRTWAKKKNEP